nr:MAG TPA: head-tail connector protein [Caudoviricetes sp.]
MNAAQSACTPPGVTSVSNDGVSMTFTSGALSERLAAETQSILRNVLGSDPHGLLYRGCF